MAHSNMTETPCDTLGAGHLVTRGSHVSQRVALDVCGSRKAASNPAYASKSARDADEANYTPDSHAGLSI